MAFHDTVTMDGYFDSARHEPYTNTRYVCVDLQQPVCLRGWDTRSVYINDLRTTTTATSANARQIVEKAVSLLRLNTEIASDVLLMNPDGLDGRPHATGGGWIPQGSGVTFYIARNSSSGSKFLCADVSIRATL